MLQYIALVISIWTNIRFASNHSIFKFKNKKMTQKEPRYNKQDTFLENYCNSIKLLTEKDFFFYLSKIF